MKKLFLVSLGALAPLVASAAPVGRAEARMLARDFLLDRGVEMQDEPAPFRAPRRGRAAAADEAYYYVFNAGDERGFVIVSGDDRTEQILGYCDHGNFHPDSIPEHMKSWLQTYANDIQWLENHNVQQSQLDVQARQMRRRSRKVYRTVPSLLPCAWNQSWPYNMYCPHYVNEDGSEGTPPAGCVAVAMAQIMYYYRYPAATTAVLENISKSYTVKTSSGTTTRTISTGSYPAGTPINWDGMRSSCSTTDEAEDVARLILYCGLSVRMSWSKSGSGSVFSRIATGLRNQFGYDQNVFVASRGNYTIDGWYDLVYDELAAGHPVGFSGNAGGSSGHAFVIDGFDGEGLFHVNWGWGGMSDGWYLLSVLKPGDQTGDGDSSTTGGYSMSQGALIGVRLPGTVVRKTDSALSTTSVSCSGTSVTATFKNETGFQGSFDVGLAVYNEANDTYSIIPRATQTLADMKEDESRSVTFNLNARLTEGVYKISPASKQTNADEWHAQYDFRNRYILATVSALRVPSLQMKEPVTSLEIDSIWFPTGCVVGNQQEVRVRIRNTGDEFYGKIMLYGGYDGQKESLGSKAAVNIRQGESVTMSYYFTPSRVGTMTLHLCNDGGSVTYASRQVEIISETSAARLSVEEITLENQLNGTIYSNRLQGSFQIKNLGDHAFNGKIKMQRWIQKSAGSTTYVSSSSNTFEISVAAGRTTTVPFQLTGLRYGLNYQLVFYYVGQSGTLGNGALWTHYFKMNPGTIYWEKDGLMKPLGDATTINAPTAACALYMSNVDVQTVRANRNSNTLYVLSGSSTTPTGLESANLVVDGRANHISLVDGQPFYVPVAFTAAEATFSHTFPATTDGTAWETFLMPFASDSITVDGVAYRLNDPSAPFCIYEFQRLGDDYLPTFAPATEIRVNTPYIIAAAPQLAGRTVTFHGRNVQFSPSVGAAYVLSSETFNQYGLTYESILRNVYALNPSGTAFAFMANKRLSALQTYFVTKLADDERPATIPLPPVPERLTTGLVSPPMRLPQLGVIFDLSGRRLPAGTTLRDLPGGIYVVDGRKVRVR